MYAIVRTGGKQYRVAKGQRVKIEKIEGAVGDSVQLSEVLMVGGEATKIGAPLVEGASVTATIKAQAKGPKIRVFKRLRRKGFHKTKGHRQPFTEVEISEISA